jgi:hypothetical protein
LTEQVFVVNIADMGSLVARSTLTKKNALNLSNNVVPFQKPSAAQQQRKADRVVGAYAARMWLAGVEIHVIDMRLKPQVQKPVRQQKAA